MIKLMLLRWELSRIILGEHNSIINVFRRGKQMLCWVLAVRWRKEPGTKEFKWPKNMVQGVIRPPLEPPEGTSPADTVTLSQ